MDVEELDEEEYYDAKDTDGVEAMDVEDEKVGLLPIIKLLQF